eukprot:CAMPEP_0185023762 /NCGR_PEP_ID=MMETSP1103-20130426/6392_1 /TAXON_ID=36769 /ORGANISM="Paraphysomonas bandaiensis, Strain Caron Lab Isolate" /LENGTH=128 /DNA_ID=CAMNT_0027556503 /DNA_START=168 /DNA_END=551 /DNA_ORIENTATION=-
MNEDMEVPSLKPIENQLLWEFQRFKKSIGWGAGQNFDPNDPGRYASHDMKIYGDTLQSVAPPVPPNYRVDQGWTIVVQKRIVKSKNGAGNVDETGITDRFGWHYAKAFNSDKWSDKHLEGMDVRRRAW